MSVELFKKIGFSSVYDKYMIPVSSEIISIILSYVKEKTSGRPLEMAVDVGCGTGRYTLPLIPHFKKVLGIDISETQINIAERNTSANNVSYMLALAEKLPLENNSVDLVHAGLATHWFHVEKFVSEAARVLKTKGCLAMHSFYPATEIEYKDLSHNLSLIMSEVWDTLIQYLYKTVSKHLYCQYQDIYEAVPLKDKKQIPDIMVAMQMTVPEIIGFIQSLCMYEAFMEKDLRSAEQFLIQTKKRFQKILGENSDSVQLTVIMKHYCVLACKD